MVEQHARLLRQQDLADQAKFKPQEGKQATPQLVYVPDGQGGANVQQVGAGSHVSPGAMSQAGMNSMNIPTAATRTMVEKAPSVIDFVDKLGPQLDAVVKKLGPAPGRWNDFLVGKVGENDPELTKARTNISLLETRLMNMHVGSRGSTEMMDHFHKLIDISKQSPDNLKAALGEIRDYAESVRKEGGVSDVRMGKKATKAYNPKTGMVEDIK